MTILFIYMMETLLFLVAPYKDLKAQLEVLVLKVVLVLRETKEIKGILAM